MVQKLKGVNKEEVDKWESRHLKKKTKSLQAKKKTNKQIGT